MGSLGLERGFALVTGTVLVCSGCWAPWAAPSSADPGPRALFVTGFGHDLVHLGLRRPLPPRGGWPSTAASAPTASSGWASSSWSPACSACSSADLFGLYDAPTSGLDQLAHLLLGLAAVVIGWMGRGVERREVGRSASRPLRS